MSIQWKRSLRWVAGTAALAVGLLGCGKKEAAPAKAEWQTSLDGALADGGARHRPILLTFYTDW